MAVGGRDLATAGIRHQLVAIWMDAVGDALPGAAGARWSRLYNPSLAEALSAPPARGRFSGIAAVLAAEEAILEGTPTALFGLGAPR